ncbi:MAG: HAD family hydrolase [Chlamydiia bacterium]|nr:HAD family hydrolase [Chlamydiia bacterium]
MNDDHRPVVAAFDFDGTITYRDSLFPFLLFAKSKFGFIRCILPCIPALLLYVLGLARRQGVKETILQHFFGGTKIWDLKKLGEEYAKRKLPLLVRPEALDRIRWHQEQRHRCVLVSASVDVYLEPWAKMMGFDDLLCSRLQVTRSGEITGRLQGFNCRGPEKTARLDELMGPRDQYCLYAYGDSAGDHELLTYADRPYYKRMPDEAG